MMDRQTANDLAEVVHALGRRKTATATIKESPTDGSGRVTALVSTFGPPPDSQGDVVAPGAFLKSIADWRSRGRRPAVWYGHQYDNPQAAIGVIERMYEEEKGLIIEAVLDLSHEPAIAVYEALLSGRLSEWSIGYAVLAEHPERSAKYGTYNVLDEVELLECSAVHAGANRYTRTLDVKSRSLGSDATVRFDDTARYNRLIDEAADGAPVITDEDRAATMAAVDELLTEVKLEKVNEALARAEQAAWEGRMGVNAVLDPVPVRVDARMRPVSSEDGSPSV